MSLLRNKGKTKIALRTLDQFMQNSGLPEFNYDTFKASFDSDPKIQDIVKDFDQSVITLKTDSSDELEPEQGQSSNKVSQMAKRAVDL